MSYKKAMNTNSVVTNGSPTKKEKKRHMYQEDVCELDGMDEVEIPPSSTDVTREAIKKKFTEDVAKIESPSPPKKKSMEDVAYVEPASYKKETKHQAAPAPLEEPKAPENYTYYTTTAPGVDYNMYARIASNMSPEDLKKIASSYTHTFPSYGFGLPAPPVSSTLEERTYKKGCDFMLRAFREGKTRDIVRDMKVEFAFGRLDKLLQGCDTYEQFIALYEI